MEAVPSTPITIHVWTDFVCPFCLLGERIIEQAAEGLPVHIEWMPFELRPHPTPTLRPEDDYLPRVWKSSVYPMAERLGVPIKLPTVSPQPYTRKAFLGLQYAKQAGQGNAYTTAVMKAFFQQDQNIGEDAVLKNILNGLGMDPAGLDEFINSPQANAQHDADLEHAQRMGIQAVPSVLVGRQLFSGVPSVQALREVLLQNMG
ncbi:DsbA family protein [Limnobacter sp.]|uniref:DsbA family oxidoreductase n=1 Tax=Limnobacter sp. TaxID=2003368 RepID=UPI00351495C6